MDLKKLRGVILGVLGVLGLVFATLFAKRLIDSKTASVAPAKKIIKEVVVQTVTNRAINVYLPAQGLVAAKQRIEIYSEVQGIFKFGKQLFRTGETYNKGSILVQIDAAEFLSNVKASRNDLHNQIATVLPDIKLDFPKAYPKWFAFLNAIEVSKNLPELPSMAQDNLKLFISGRGILSAYYSVKNLEERLLKYRILAPFSGVLTEALVTEGTLVRAGQKLGEFIKPGQYELLVYVPKSYSEKLAIGGQVILSNLEGSRTYQGRISKINAKVDTNTQTRAVRIEITDPSLVAGVYLKANIEGAVIPNATALPRALLSQDHTIFTVVDNALTSIKVTPAHFSETEVVVTGIPNGTQILAKPVLGAYNGMIVNTTK